MSARLSSLPALAGCLLLSGGPASVSVARPPRPVSLCAPTELPVFSCPIGGKIVSLCAAGRGAGTVTYRYGRPGRVELAQSGGLRLGRRGYSGGGEGQVSFERNGHRYFVYQRTVRSGFDADGHNEPRDEAGLVVTRGSRKLVDARCSGNGGGMNARVTDRLPRVDFVEH